MREVSNVGNTILRNLLTSLGLETSSEYLDACLNHATKQKSTYVTFLEELLEAEQLARQQRSYETRLKLSHEGS